LALGWQDVGNGGPMNNETNTHIEHLARDFVTRAVGVIGLAGIALIHLLDSLSKFSETPYVAWLYVALMAGSVAVAGGLVHSRDRRLWLAAGLLAASAIAGYVLSRTTGLPNATGDVGNWGEPLGVASLFVEGTVVALSAYAYRATAKPALAGVALRGIPGRRLQAAA
jgi:hypothetical protein